MNATEFRPIAAKIQSHWFDFPIPRTAMAQYVASLADLPAGEVEAAVDAITAEGGDRPPKAGRIRQRVAELQLGAPIWAEVKRSLIARHDAVQAWQPPEWTCPYDECDGSGFVYRREPAKVVALRAGEVVRYDTSHEVNAACRCRPERIQARRLAETLHPLVREFISEKYVTWAEVEEVGKGGATTLEAQMRSKWEAFVGRAVESRSLAAVDAPEGMTRIETARSEDERRGGPRRLSEGSFAGMLERGAA